MASSKSFQRVFIRKTIISIFVLLLIFLLLVFLKTDFKEEFKDIPKWIETMKCLKIDTKENLDQIKNMITNGEDPNIGFHNIMTMSEKKGLTDKEIFNCFIP